MSRSLRSNSRQKKLQVQEIKQVDKALRSNISNCTETKIDCFEQREFLSLFELTPVQKQHVINGENFGSERRITRSLKGLNTIDDSNNNNQIKKQRKIAFGKT